MDLYYEMTNATHAHEYQAVDTAQGADDKELQQLLLDERDAPASSRPKELDHWFLQVYEYYCQKGLACILTSQILDILTIAATWFFSGFVMLCIDWGVLARCSDCMSENDGECKEVCRKIITSPGGSGLYSAVVSSYLLVLLAYLVYRALVLAKEMKSWYNMQSFFNDDLGIADSELQAMEWTMVTQKIIALQHRFPSKFIKEFHDEHDITSRILRKDNYMIALVDGPLQDAMHLDHPWLNPLMGPKSLTHTLDWILRICLLDRMFDEDYRVDPQFLQSELSLRQTFYIAGFVNLVFSPFIIMFVLVYFALKNAQRYHADPRTLSTRSWCLYAKYTFRKYNELPHCFQRRLIKAIPWAEKYVEQFASPLLSVYARFAAFIFSSMLAFLIALWVINEQMMKLDFYLLGMHRNLYWYMGMFAMGLGMVRSLIIHQTSPCDAREPLVSCLSYLHYYPRHWKDPRLSLMQVHGEFTELFMLNVAIPGLHRCIFVQEMLGVIITPFILWFVLPDKAGEILAFLRANTVEKKAVNCICSYADFSHTGFCRHATVDDHEAVGEYGPTGAGDMEMGASLGRSARSGGADSSGQAVGYGEGTREVGPLDNKFQKSFVGFKANNPMWEPPQQGQQLLCKLMETIELRSEVDLDRRPGSLRTPPLRHLARPLGFSAGLCLSGHSDPAALANATAALIASSQYLPPEEADKVHNVVLQRYRTFGNMMGGGLGLGLGHESIEARVPRLGHSSGGRWGLGADVNENLGELSMRGRRLEMDEQLLNVLLMECSELSHGVPGGQGLALQAMESAAGEVQYGGGLAGDGPQEQEEAYLDQSAGLECGVRVALVQECGGGSGRREVGDEGVGSLGREAAEGLVMHGLVQRQRVDDSHVLLASPHLEVNAPVDGLASPRLPGEGLLVPRSMAHDGGDEHPGLAHRGGMEAGGEYALGSGAPFAA